MRTNARQIEWTLGKRGVNLDKPQCVSLVFVQKKWYFGQSPAKNQAFCPKYTAIWTTSFYYAETFPGAAGWRAAS